MAPATRSLSLFLCSLALSDVHFVDIHSNDTMDMITQSIVAFLQPHTSFPSTPLVAHAMCCLMTGDFSGEDFNQVLHAQLDSLAISPQTKQSIIPALLGITKLAKVQSQRYVHAAVVPL